MKPILAVDPGVASGWAQRATNGTFAWGTIRDQYAMCDMIDRWCRRWDEEAVLVCEAYVITPTTSKKTFQPASLEIIGMARWAARKWKHAFVLQLPSEKKFMPDTKLRDLGWYNTGEGHDNDALRHLGIYLAKVERDERILRAGLR